MNADEIRKLLHAVPFHPFKVFLPSDKSFQVPHADFAHITPNGRIMIISENETDATEILDVPLITRIQLLPNGEPQS
jgi:hypothetical protein